jgi:hypothetical protein
MSLKSDGWLRRLYRVFGGKSLVFCCEAPTPYSIVKSMLNYQKKDSIDSKVDVKPPFAMLLMTSIPKSI